MSAIQILTSLCKSLRSVDNKNVKYCIVLRIVSIEYRVHPQIFNIFLRFWRENTSRAGEGWTGMFLSSNESAVKCEPLTILL